MKDDRQDSVIHLAELGEDISQALFAFMTGFGVEFKARRGVRVVYGAALEKRSPLVAERGFESHPLRHY